MTMVGLPNQYTWNIPLPLPQRGVSQGGGLLLFLCLLTRWLLQLSPISASTYSPSLLSADSIYQFVHFISDSLAFLEVRGQSTTIQHRSCGRKQTMRRKEVVIVGRDQGGYRELSPAFLCLLLQWQHRRIEYYRPAFRSSLGCYKLWQKNLRASVSCRVACL